MREALRVGQMLCGVVLMMCAVAVGLGWFEPSLRDVAFLLYLVAAIQCFDRLGDEL